MIKHQGGAKSDSDFSLCHVRLESALQSQGRYFRIPTKVVEKRMSVTVLSRNWPEKYAPLAWQPGRF